MKTKEFVCKECNCYCDEEYKAICECCNKKVCWECIKESYRGESLCVECFEWKYY